MGGGGGSADGGGVAAFGGGGPEAMVGEPEGWLPGGGPWP
jgi:hypothetical protein